MHYSKSDIVALLSPAADRAIWQGRLSVPGFENPILLRIELADAEAGPCDKTVRVINQLVQMSEAGHQRIRQFLFDDAMRTKAEVAFGDNAMEVEKPGFWKRLFRQKPTYTFTALAPNDERHPCYFKNGVADVDRKVKYEEIYVSEPNQATLRHEFAILFCYPAWEDEHGVSIVIRNGKPIALVQEYEPSLAEYDDI